MSNGKNKVAIIGYGYVGKAMQKIFPDALLYDVNPIAIDGTDSLNATKEQINTCALAIVCVPTPMQFGLVKEFTAVDTSIVEEVLSWLTTPLVLIKSTVPPGTTARLSAQWPASRGRRAPRRASG